MKVFLLKLSLILLCIPYLSFAWNYDNNYFKISIRNNTPETCFLVHKNILSGYETKLLPITTQITSGTESTFLLYMGLNGVCNIALTYFCGDSRNISFVSTRNSWGKALFYGEDIISGEILSSADMDAIFEIQHGTLLGGPIEGKPGEIHWILS